MTTELEAPVTKERLTPESLKPIIERRQKVRFWGRNYFVTPRVCPTALGDGQRAIYFTPINTRPNWYVVLVDSLWQTSNYADGETIGDHYEDICCALEDAFGRAWIEDDDGKEVHQPFPALNDEGASWGDCDVERERRETEQARRRSRRRPIAPRHPAAQVGCAASAMVALLFVLGDAARLFR